jgi:hypothetical protein
MKPQILAGLLLASLTTSVFALPLSEPQPLLGEAKASSDTLRILSGDGLAEGGAERVPQHLRLVEDGYDLTPQGQRYAENDAERVLMHVAEDGSARTRQHRGV